MSQDREGMEIENNSWREFCECINICLQILAAPCRVLIVSPVSSQAADLQVNVVVITLWHGFRVGPLSTSIHSCASGILYAEHRLRAACSRHMTHSASESC
jgi:hypothetical protein